MNSTPLIKLNPKNKAKDPPNDTDIKRWMGGKYYEI